MHCRCRPPLPPLVCLNFHVLDTQGLCQAKRMLCTFSHSNVCLAAQPASLQRQPRRNRRGCKKQTLWRTRAAEDSGKGTDVVDVQKIGTIPFSRDEETMVDVMAFAGPAPEVNAATFHGLHLPFFAVARNDFSMPAAHQWAGCHDSLCGSSSSRGSHWEDGAASGCRGTHFGVVHDVPHQCGINLSQSRCRCAACRAH